MLVDLTRFPCGQLAQHFWATAKRFCLKLGYPPKKTWSSPLSKLPLQTHSMCRYNMIQPYWIYIYTHYISHYMDTYGISQYGFIYIPWYNHMGYIYISKMAYCYPIIYPFTSQKLLLGLHYILIHVFLTPIL